MSWILAWISCKLAWCTVREWHLGRPINIGNGYWSYYGKCQICGRDMRTWFHRETFEKGRGDGTA